MDGDPTQIIVAEMREDCSQNCIAAKLVIGNTCEFIKNGDLVDPETVGRKLGQCVLGPEVVGQCGTEKTVCRHEATAHTQDSNEQIRLLAEYIL